MKLALNPATQYSVILVLVVVGGPAVLVAAAWPNGEGIRLRI